MESDPAPPYHIRGLSIEVGDGEAPTPAEQPAIRADQSPGELAAALDRFLCGWRRGWAAFARGFGVLTRRLPLSGSFLLGLKGEIERLEGFLERG
jgi:hypothetical protein